jgi:hypothetical protein
MSAAIYEQRLRAVLTALQRYLPPDGVSAHDTLSEIIGLVDPWPAAESAQGQREVVAPALLAELEELRKNGPVIRRGSRGDGVPWMGTMREVLEDYKQAAHIEAQARREAMTELRALKAPQAPSEAAGAAQPVAWLCEWDTNWRQYHDSTDPLPAKWDDEAPTVTPLYTSPTAAPEGWREAMEKALDALENLLNDTQHAEHPDCDDGPCPVREARAVLSELRAALNQEVEPRTVRMPLKEEQVTRIMELAGDWATSSYRDALNTTHTHVTPRGMLRDYLDGINSGTKGESK